MTPMNGNELEKQLAQVQERLAQLERAERPRRLRRTVLAVLAGLAAGTAVAATWPAGFVAGNPAKAADLNDYLNDLDTRVKAGIVPPNTVAFFACSTMSATGCITTCPPGWQAFSQATGRVIVGADEARNSSRQVGSPPLAENENRAHGHQWMRMRPSGPNVQWESFQTDGGAVRLVEWDNGMDTVGSGNYPIGTDSTANQDYFTTRDTSGLPYVQLLACRKL